MGQPSRACPSRPCLDRRRHHRRRLGARIARHRPHVGACAAQCLRHCALGCQGTAATACSPIREVGLRLILLFDQAQRHASELQPEHWGSAAFGLALASMAHERQYSRLFRS